MKENAHLNFNISFGPKSQGNSQLANKETPESNISFQSEDLLSQYRDISPQIVQRKRIVLQNSFNTFDKQNVLSQTLRPKAFTQQFVKIQKLMKTMSLVQRFKSNLFMNSYILPTNSKQDFFKIEKYTNQTQSNDLKKKNETDLNNYLIQPSSPLSQCFDMISLCVQLLTLWLISFIVIFTRIDEIQASLVLFVIFFLIFELFFTLNKATIFQGQIVEDRKLIFQIWLKKSSFLFIIEIVVCIYITINYQNMYSNNAFILLIQIFAIIGRILQQYDNLMETLYQLSVASDLLDLITLIISIYFFAHFIACFWLFFGLQQQEEGSWITYYELSNQSIWIQYSTSFYWATMTMVTVGYGDITPKNQYEMIFCDIAMFLSSCVFAYSMNSIGIILKNINDQKVNYKKRAIILNEYMKQNDISSHIQDKVRNYLRHEIHSEYNSIQEEALKIIKQLPKGLEQEIHNNMNSRIVNKIKLLQFFSKWTKQQLIDKIELCNYTPKEFIYHQDSNQNLDLFFIYKGCVDICEEQSQHNIFQVKEGEIFGEYSFITGCNPKTCAISNGFSQIAKIKRETFLKVISEVRQDYEKLHHIKDKILLYNDHSDLMVNCKFCKKTSHSFYTCPMLTYSPDLEQRLKKDELYQYEQERYKCDRSTQGKKNSLVKQKEILDNIKEYQEINGIDQIDDLNQSDVKTESYDEDPFYYNQDIQASMKNIVNLPKMVARCSRISMNQNNHFRIRQSIIQNQQQNIRYTLKQNQIINTGLLLSNSTNNPKTGLDVQKKIGQKNMLEIFQDQLQFQNCDIDRIQEYEEYMKHNNFKIVIKDVHQRPKFARQQLKASKYTYNYFTKMMIIKMREFYDEDEINENLFTKTIKRKSFKQFNVT